MEEEKKTTHPSFGMVGLSRVQGSTKLFGSSVDHQHYVTLSVYEASHHRGLHCDHFYAEDPILEIALSPNQLSELLLSVNVGDGVPCTIIRRIVGGKFVGIEPAEKHCSTTETYVTEFKERMKDLSLNARKLVVDASAMAEKASVSKTERRDMASRLSMMVQELESNMPFALEMYIEQVEKVVTQAKAELEAFRTHLQALPAGAPTLTLDAPKTTGENNA